MKPFKTIDSQKKVIEELTYELKFSKNKVKSANRINTLIDTVNDFEKMMSNRYKTDAVNVLIYSLIYEWFLSHGVGEGKKIPLHYMVDCMDKDLSNDSQHKKEEIISMLKTNENLKMIDDNTIYDWNGEYKDYDTLLTKLLNEFKQHLAWKK